VPFLTPASSLGLVDVQKNTLVGELDTAGCVMAIPAGANRVSSICENGTLQTLTLDSEGHEAGRGVSPVFFSVDKDPIFVQGIPVKNTVTFLSFDGLVYEADVSGAKASIKAPWSLVTPAEKGRWRPGGMQIAAISSTLRRLYVPMHVGGQEMHKEGGTQIWVYDLDTHQRLARWSLGSPNLKPVISVQITQDDKPLLFAITADSDVVIYDGLTGKLKHVEKQLGQTPWMMFNP
jgi:methylamine dehydrogenase heavy chain